MFITLGIGRGEPLVKFRRFRGEFSSGDTPETPTGRLNEPQTKEKPRKSSGFRLEPGLEDARLRAMKRSLVLGGGGVVGIGWLVGVVSGLADRGIDLSGDASPDEVIGTSAGSFVGALIAQHRPAEFLRTVALDDANSEVVSKAMPAMDLLKAFEVFETWAALPDTSAKSLATVGALALGAPTISEDEWSHSPARSVGVDWPPLPYSCIAVDATSGEYVQWNRDSGVALDLAVASSCTVPGMFPPVTIGPKRYVDGGLRSGTNADLALGSQVLVLAPIGSHTDAMDAGARLLLTAETALLQARGVNVVELLPDAEANRATLSTALGRMDPDMRALAIEHGTRQGRELARVLTGW
jgi:NTE family protein